MTAQPNENERIITRINRVLSRPGDKARYSSEDERVLTYIRNALAPEAVEKRPEEDAGVGHLHQVAKQRLAPYEREGTT